jgi:hypothetical protein
MGTQLPKGKEYGKMWHKIQVITHELHSIDYCEYTTEQNDLRKLHGIQHYQNHRRQHE